MPNDFEQLYAEPIEVEYTPVEPDGGIQLFDDILEVRKRII